MLARVYYPYIMSEAKVDLPAEFQGLGKPSDDAEAVSRLDALTEAVRNETVITKDQIGVVIATCKPFVGSLGDLSTEIESAVGRLMQVARTEKKIW